MRTGKRARTETAIGRGTASISHAAVEMVTDRLGGLAGRRVLVVGAGEMGVGVATALHRAGVADIVVANRTPERGLRLAEDVGGRAVGLDELVPTLAATDVVLACTASGESVVTTADLHAAGAGDAPDARRRHRRAPLRRALGAGAARASPCSTSTTCATGPTGAWRCGRPRRHRVGTIVAEELEHFMLEAAARQAAPLVAQLHERAEEIRTAELGRFAARLAPLTEDERDTVEALTRTIVAKLLHQPSVRLRHDAGTPQGERNAAAVVDLFDLG